MRFRQLLGFVFGYELLCVSSELLLSFLSTHIKPIPLLLTVTRGFASLSDCCVDSNTHLLLNELGADSRFKEKPRRLWDPEKRKVNRAQRGNRFCLAQPHQKQNMPRVGSDAARARRRNRKAAVAEPLVRNSSRWRSLAGRYGGRSSNTCFLLLCQGLLCPMSTLVSY
jgi:hypothetical protein